MKVLFVFLAGIAYVHGQSCANGNKLMHLGVAPGAPKTIMDTHNRYRLMIAQGKVPRQPQGTNLLRMIYAEELQHCARAVSLQCEMQHITVKDVTSRWEHVGQNMYVEYNSVANMTQNWETAITAWYEEHEAYTYGNGFTPSTGHYTQMVWADTYEVGCDFVMFYDYGRPSTPFGKLYTCNYGPGGNILGQNPYEIDDSSECVNLC